MNNTDSYKAKPVIFSTILVLLATVLLSCMMPTLTIFTGECFQKVNSGNGIKDPATKAENSVDEEFLEDIIHKFYADDSIAMFSDISNHFSANNFDSSVPRVSLDIPVRPPKNHISQFLTNTIG